MSLHKPPKERGAWDYPAELLDDPFGGPRPEAYDALTDLFLGDPASGPASPAAATPAPVVRLHHPPRRITLAAPAVHPPRTNGSEAAPARAPVRARIEGLILGHLPVLASPWIMQYARHVAAEARGVVALVRARPGEGSLELIAAGGGPSLPRLRAATLAEAVDAVGGMVAAWLIRVDEPSEPLLAQVDGLDAVTLLTGVDEAATVAAYRAIKHLTPGDDEGLPEVRLALMGAPAERAEAALSRLARAAEAFLQRRVAVAACVDKVSGGRSELVWSGPVESPLGETFAWLCAAVRSARTAAPRPRPVEPGPRAASQDAPRMNFARPAAPPSPPPPPAPEPPPVARTEAAAPPPPASPTPPATAPRPREALTRHFPDLFPLSIRCPYAPGVELAIGTDGALHLLALDAAPAASDAVAGLIAVAAWVRDHLPLLQPAAATEGRRIIQGDPVMHLLTLDARSVRGLLDTGVKLHLLAIARAGEHTAWACAELN